MEPGKFYSVAMGDRDVGINIALGDVDTPEKGVGNFGRFTMKSELPATPSADRTCGMGDPSHPCIAACSIMTDANGRSSHLFRSVRQPLKDHMETPRRRR